MLRQQQLKKQKPSATRLKIGRVRAAKGQERHLNALPLMEAVGGREVSSKMWYKALEGANEPQFLVFHPAS